MSTSNNKLNLSPSKTDFLDSFLNSKDKSKILERAVESARNGIVITDPLLPENPIVYANQAFLELTGYSLEEVIGKNCKFLQGKDQKQKEIEELRSAIRAGKAHITILRNYKKDGSLFWNELSTGPVHNQDGKVIKFIGVQNDVSARKEAELRVSEFYSAVSHELRTPLSSIKAAMELIRDGSCGIISGDATKLIDISINNSQRLLRLIDNILDLKKMESGHIKLALTSIIPDELVGEVLASLSQLADSADVRLEKGDCSRIPVIADLDLIKQVLINLVGNAIKFSPPASAVKVRVQNQQDIAKFFIDDEGAGIDPEDMSKLFTKFTQLDSSDTRLQSGSGLGLAISKNIIELHNGAIGVDSTVGTGSSFWFTLPLQEEGNINLETRQ